MNRTEAAIMLNLITQVKNEMLGVHCTKAWSEPFKKAVFQCEEILITYHKCQEESKKIQGGTLNGASHQPPVV